MAKFEGTYIASDGKRYKIGDGPPPPPEVVVTPGEGGVQQIEVTIPPIIIPPVEVNIPDVNIPDVQVAMPAIPPVEVTIPDVVIPDVHVAIPDVNIPDVQVQMPDVVIPDVVIPPVEVTIPDVNIPPVEVNLPPDSQELGTLTASAPASLTGVGQTAGTVVVNARESSGYMAQIKGPFTGSVVTEGSADGGATWVATAWRQSVSGGVGNVFNSTRLVNNVGLLRGSTGGFTHYRVRCVTLTSGTIDVVLTTHNGTAATFQNTFIESRTMAQYYVAAAGGRVLFNATTDILTLATGEQSVAALVNPANSGLDVYIDSVEIGASAISTYRRIRGATITATGAAQPVVNSGGGSATAQAKLYRGGSTGATFTRTGGTVGKATFLGANSPFVSNMSGTAVLRPGEAVLWTMTGGSGQGITASLYAVWWETAAAV